VTELPAGPGRRPGLISLRSSRRTCWRSPEGFIVIPRRGSSTSPISRWVSCRTVLHRLGGVYSGVRRSPTPDQVPDLPGTTAQDQVYVAATWSPRCLPISSRRDGAERALCRRRTTTRAAGGGHPPGGQLGIAWTSTTISPRHQPLGQAAGRGGVRSGTVGWPRSPAR
jgi:hypothetical protein